MKKVLFVLFVVAMIISSCQTKTKVAPVDLAAAKVAVTELLREIQFRNEIQRCKCFNIPFY